MDPRTQNQDNIIIEAVPGACKKNLVDGKFDPDRWDYFQGGYENYKKTKGESKEQLLDIKEVIHIAQRTVELEKIFNFSPDIEWTGKGKNLTILQARPITKPIQNKKSYYLTLMPNDEDLKDLANEVSNQLIPNLEHEGNAFALIDLETLDDKELSQEIKKRHLSLKNGKWFIRIILFPLPTG